MRVVIHMLGPDSAFGRAFLADSEDDGWSVTDYLIANLIDVGQVGNWLQTDTKKSKKPKPFPRPADRRKAQKVVDTREQRAQAHIANPNGD